MRWLRRHSLSEEELSTYLDGRLAGEEARRVESHLEACEACRLRLEELRATVRALRALSTADVPRSFVLGQAAVLGPEARAAPPTARAYRLAGALSAVALAVFVALIATDLTTLGGGGPERARPGQAFGLMSGDSAAEEAAPAQEAPAAPLGDMPRIGRGEAQEAAPSDEGAKEMPALESDEDAMAEALEERFAEDGGGADAGRWALRAFEAAAGAAFLLTLFVAARRWRSSEGGWRDPADL